MLISMTGFSRVLHNSSFGQFIVEIQSLNRKFLEITLSLPNEFSQFEPEIRRWVGTALRRGAVSLRILLVSDGEESMVPSVDLLKKQKDAWLEIARACDCSEEEVTLSFLYKTLPAQSRKIDEQESFTAVQSSVHEALEKLIAMKQKEGELLEKEIQNRLQELKKIVASIRDRAPQAREALQRKLKEQIESVLQEKTIEERLFLSIVAFSDRVDCTEELARLDAHYLQFQKIKEGRTLDFLIQEMGRELNTIGSKSSDLTISHLVVAAKSEVEKIKEQLHNVE
jgi:uncharacterized protein (TIGR00255 family)